MDGGREALLPALAQQVLVGRVQEVLRGHGTQQAAERAGQQQRAGAGRGALAADVDERDLQVRAVGGPAGHQEVAGERVAVGRAQERLDLPPRRQCRHLALHAQPVAQVDQHRLAQVALQAEPGAAARHEEHQHRHRGEHDHHAAVQPGGPLHLHVDQARDHQQVEQRQRQRAQQEAAGDQHDGERGDRHPVVVADGGEGDGQGQDGQAGEVEPAARQDAPADERAGASPQRSTPQWRAPRTTPRVDHAETLLIVRAQAGDLTDT